MKALLVEESPTVCAVMEYALKHEGWDLTVAETQEQAMELLSSEGETIDIVIVDHSLDHIDGLSVLERSSKLNHNPKSILLSQDDRSEITDQAQNLGAICWLHKPVSMASLLKAITYSQKDDE